MRLLKELEKDKRDKILGLLLSALALLLFISLITYDFTGDHSKIVSAVEQGEYGSLISDLNNRGGIVGALIAYFLYVIFGYCSMIVPVLLAGWGINRFFGWSGSDLRKWSLISGGFILGLMALTSLQYGRKSFGDLGVTFGGAIGHYIAKATLTLFGTFFSYTLIISLIIMGLALIIPSAFKNLLGRALAFLSEAGYFITSKIKLLRKTKTKIVEETPDPEEKKGLFSGLVLIRKKRKNKKIESVEEIQSEFTSDEEDEFSGEELENGNDSPFSKTARRKLKKGEYQLPILDLLDDPPADQPIPDEAAYRRTADALRKTLSTFGVEIEADTVNIFPGPIITRFEFKPASGIKVSQIVNLADDLALAMQADRIRIVAPIPGKPAVGVEIPNRMRRGIFIKEITSTAAFEQASGRLSLALGKTISGEPYVVDLAKMPHLLIAGSTGSGKSVCLNVIITSLIFKLHPDEVRFIFIDPKRLELTVYNGLPHMEKPVVTEMRDAERFLGDAALEMEERYRTLARAGVRNIEDYNKASKDKIPYLIIVVDELADLMISGLNRVESLITRLAQMARAVGIHLILATQRPSVDVITGLIKANFSTRIAFQTATKVDSRTILDANGAEKLLGSGDMLFSKPGMPEPVRIHGAFVSGDETERVVEFICEQEFRTKPIEIFEKSSKESVPGFDPASDPLYREAVELVIRHKQGSVSLLQRRLGIGYQRAARLIDQLENSGIVGPYDGSKAREVLVDEAFLESDDRKA
ncbi:MAG: DNA translocase FtsK 4TM domain-containing protein [candidate division Zixibacteria bacterium]